MTAQDLQQRVGDTDQVDTLSLNEDDGTAILISKH